MGCSCAHSQHDKLYFQFLEVHFCQQNARAGFSEAEWTGPCRTYCGRPEVRSRATKENVCGKAQLRAPRELPRRLTPHLLLQPLPLRTNHHSSFSSTRPGAARVGFHREGAFPSQVKWDKKAAVSSGPRNQGPPAVRPQHRGTRCEQMTGLGRSPIVAPSTSPGHVLLLHPLSTPGSATLPGRSPKDFREPQRGAPHPPGELELNAERRGSCSPLPSRPSQGSEPPSVAPAGPPGRPEAPGPRPAASREPRSPRPPAPAEQRHNGDGPLPPAPSSEPRPARPDLRRHVRGRRGPARGTRRGPAARAGKAGRAEGSGLRGAGGPAPLCPGPALRRPAGPLRAEPCPAARPDPAARAVPLPAWRPPGPGPAAPLTSLSCRSAASRSAGSMVPRRASMMVLGSMPAAAGGGGQGPGPRRAVRTWTRRLAAAAGAKGREAPKARIERPPPPPPARQRRPSAARAPPRAARPHGSCSSGARGARKAARRHRLLQGRARRCWERGLLHAQVTPPRGKVSRAARNGIIPKRRRTVKEKPWT